MFLVQWFVVQGLSYIDEVQGLSRANPSRGCALELRAWRAGGS